MTSTKNDLSCVKKYVRNELLTDNFNFLVHNNKEVEIDFNVNVDHLVGKE